MGPTSVSDQLKTLHLTLLLRESHCEKALKFYSSLKLNVPRPKNRRDSEFISVIVKGFQVDPGGNFKLVESIQNCEAEQIHRTPMEGKRS